MGCGCKNKGNQAQPTAEQQKMQQEAIQKAAIVRNDALKESIKKTVEKYYNVQKKTNGYIPE
jgi:ribosomal protein L23